MHNNAQSVASDEEHVGFLSRCKIENGERGNSSLELRTVVKSPKNYGMQIDFLALYEKCL
jgi:hypothetical protein